MDQRRALVRSKVREAQKREKRIDSPLVRYNENDQPVCRVCNVVLKSESQWPAHQISKKHHEAIENLKASATGLSRENVPRTEVSKEQQNSKLSSTLPAGFFDDQNSKRQKIDSAGGKAKPIDTPVLVGSGSSYIQDVKKDSSPSINRAFDVPHSTKKKSHKVLESNEEKKEFTKFAQPSKIVDGTDAELENGALPPNFFDTDAEQVTRALPPNFFDDTRTVDDQTPKQLNREVENQDGLALDQVNTISAGSNHISRASKRIDGSDAKQTKGALPEGFFDNKDADLRARGIEPVKVDINDAYKEFEKEIQVNLQVVDDRLEEEEIDAAEEMEGFRSLEQKAYKERVDEIKKKLVEVRTERLAKAKQRPAFMGKQSSDESSSDEGDDDEDDNFAVNWRAQHL
ncbi:protein ABA AND ROS SENSITIVE 1-like [Zingiber officinale]|uniref:protein ABA AND ROS SENSITIVE 1-like n=1 Tax=Zingiber officinale TaxID=94328 RepID=UPI001C4BBDD0|nr:protein ABA AND ROS SENSITIVE 1-like [Zingiber officinale]